MLIKNSQQTISINKLFKKLKWKKENQNYEKNKGGACWQPISLHVC